MIPGMSVEDKVAHLQGQVKGIAEAVRELAQAVSALTAQMRRSGYPGPAIHPDVVQYPEPPSARVLPRWCREDDCK